MCGSPFLLRDDFLTGGRPEDLARRFCLATGHGRFAGPGLLVHARPFAAPPCRHQGESGGSAGPVEAACFQHGDVVAVLVVLTVSVRSALWPGPRCLSSMLTGPCPVSALLHAGVVNGGASFSSA